MIKAILFDMDGVIYDSMPGNAQAWCEALKSAGIDCSHEDLYTLEGRTARGVVNIFYNKLFSRDATQKEIDNIYAYKCRRFSELEPKGSKPMKGIKQILSIVKEMDIQRLIVTGSGQCSLFNGLEENFPGIFDLNKIVTAYDVKKGKPDPEPYLMGLQKASVISEEAIVIENAPLGVQAAKAAGIYTIAVNTGPLDDSVLINAGADLVYSSMYDLSKDLTKIIYTRAK